MKTKLTHFKVFQFHANKRAHLSAPKSLHQQHFQWSLIPLFKLQSWILLKKILPDPSCTPKFFELSWMGAEKPNMPHQTRQINLIQVPHWESLSRKQGTSLHVLVLWMKINGKSGEFIDGHTCGAWSTNKL